MSKLIAIDSPANLKLRRMFTANGESVFGLTMEDISNMPDANTAEGCNGCVHFKSETDNKWSDGCKYCARYYPDLYAEVKNG